MLSFFISNLLVVPSIIAGIGYTDNNLVTNYLVDTNSQSMVVVSTTNTVVHRDEISVEARVSATNNYTTPNINVASGSIVATAMSLIGVPYVANGSTISGMDCSGFTMFVYAQNGIQLPHSSTAQGAMGIPISEADAQPGDLLIWPGHVAIWLAPGTMIDSAVPGTTVQVRPIWGTPTIVRIN